MKRVLVIATGGTIASAEEGSGLAPALTGEQLVAFVPEVAQACYVEVSQVMNVDSTNMRSEGWLAIAGEVRRRYDDFDGFVVLHGTDTLAYTAAGLVACDDAAAGVMVAFGGKVVSGTAARKVRTRSFEAFDSLNVPDLGLVCDGQVEWAADAEATAEASGVRFYDALNPRVAVLKLTPGMDALVIDALRPACDALVVEAFGLGGIPEYDGITDTLLAWVDAGKTLVMTTQCPYEGADLSVYEVGRAFCDRPGVLMGGSATTEALLAKTMWALAQVADPDGVVDRKKLAELFASC